jgi:hypothetical protein
MRSSLSAPQQPDVRRVSQLKSETKAFHNKISHV